MHTGFWWRYLSERDHLENPDADGRIMLKCIVEKWDGAWIGPIFLRTYRRHAVVNAVMNLLISQE